MLTDKECKAAKAGDKPVKLFDAHGLHLFVSTTGHKSWRLKYRIRGKEKQVSFGSYPAVKLVEARAKSAAARQLVQDGVDPSLEFGKRAKNRLLATETANTFESVAKSWHREQLPIWKDRYANEVITSLKRDVFPKIGLMDIRNVRARDP
jgi:hypothetical protein